MIKTKEKKHLKTFSIHEKDLSIVKEFQRLILQYKHLENIINILMAYEFNSINNNTNSQSTPLSKEIFKLLQNKIIMKLVLKNNTGGEKTSYDVAKVNDYYKNHYHSELFVQAKIACEELNDKNVGEIIGRLHKDWSNFFLGLKNKSQAGQVKNPSYPKPKKLSKVYNYSVPLEVSKFSLAKEDKGLLGINLGKNMVYVKYFNAKKNKENNNKPTYLNKKINSVTVFLSHGHVYYNLQYVIETKSLVHERLIENKKPKKFAGLDTGVNELASIFVNDKDTKSIIISGKELISYNCYFNKRLAEINEQIAKEVKEYKEITNSAGNKQLIPEEYSKKGKLLQNRKSQLFERRKLYMDDYMQKLSKKVAFFLNYMEVDCLVISKNLSFTKTTGEIEMNKKTKQKFYQIPFGRFLNLLESKLESRNIDTVEIDESYTSKTSSLTADIVKIKEIVKNKGKEHLVPNDFNGSRGSKKKNNVNNPLGRGLFKDKILNKIIHADLNAAANHIKIASPGIVLNKNLFKYCNPKKIKSNHEFDKLLKTYQIVHTQKSLDFSHVDKL